MQETLIQFVRRSFAPLPEFVQHNAMLAGGALRAYFDATEIKDYDLFFRSEDDYRTALIAMQADASFEWMNNAGRTKVYRDLITGRIYNLIGFCFANPDETMKRFDFRCCRMVAWLCNGMVWMVADPHAATDARAKALVVELCNGHARTKRRIDHYVNDYGYRLQCVVGELDEFLESLPQADGGYPIDPTGEEDFDADE